MRLIYPTTNDKDEEICALLTPTPKFLAQLTGTEEEKLIHLANKQLPTGTKYEIIADSVDLSDRAFRDAWTYTADASVEKTSADLTEEELASYNMTENL